MKTKLLSLLLLFLSFSIFGKQVDENKAKAVGLYFLQNKTNSQLLKSATNLQLTYKVTAKLGDALEEKTMFYIFNIDAIGYIIVAGDDTVIPILGYSDHGNFISNNMPSALEKWLEGYKNEIIYVINNDVKATEDIKKQWNLEFTNKNSNSTMSTNSVLPLLGTIKWDQFNGSNQQSPLYNNLCPLDPQFNVRTVTGCVATAMAQIMKFWNYPATGSSFHSYPTQKYGTLSANFGNTTYQWSSMPNQLTTSSTTAQKNAVATLMFHCGVSVDMDYGVALPPPNNGGSGAAGAIKVQPALVNYFGFQNATISPRSSFSETNWINLLKSELNAGRPMYYEGAGGGSGHAFVCDGYDTNNMFNFNWGWSGGYDGFFLVNALNPQGTGTGGGSGTYNSNQKIVKGIQPPASAINYNLALYNFVTPSATTIGYGNAFTVTTNIANYGTNNFTGDYTLAAFDSNNNFIDYIETKTNLSLQSQNAYSNNLIFSTTGLFSLLPGNYTLGLFYRPTGGGWKAVQNSGSYTNFTQINVVNTNSIALNSTMVVSPSTTLTQGQGASVNLNIANNGTITFTGVYNVSLYTLNGVFVQTIGQYNETAGLPSGFTYSTPFLTFSTTTVTASPGTYLLALQHQLTGGNFQLTGSTSSFINPIRVIVQQAPYQADIYENNDSFSQSYNLPLSFSGNTANVNTNSSNAHTGADNDYYKIVLPTGYNYTISPRLHDSYSSNNGNTYTLDALFTYSTDGVNWSTVYDDVISGNIIINNGGTIYFRTASYFQGNTGTYLLDINLTRTATLGVDANEFPYQIKLFPNPTKSKVFFDNSITNFKEVAIYNYLGQEVAKTSFSNNVNNQEIDMSNLATGVYVLKFSDGATSKSVKVVKQ